MEIDWKNSPYDFVDFGSKVGGSMEFAIKKLGGKRGLGIDIREDMVKKAKEAGYDVIVGDATKLNIPNNSVRFTVISHFLEHMPNIESVKLAIENAIRISTDFIYIRGPVFDNDEYLKSLGLRVFWSDWPGGHTCHLTTNQLVEIFKSLGISDYDLKFEVKIPDSNSPNIHSVNSPSGQHEYDPKIHPPKPYVKFSPVLYREFSCIVKLNK